MHARILCLLSLLCIRVMALTSSPFAVPSSQPSPSQQINLGPSSNPSAKPSDFHFLKVIGKGSFGKVLLARHRTDDQFYAVKVLQKKAILKKKEVRDVASAGNTNKEYTFDPEVSPRRPL